VGFKTRSRLQNRDSLGANRVFDTHRLKPTQYLCASEALLRRLRKKGSLPRIHPLIDLCNAVSVAFAVPVAVFDLSKVAGYLEVRYAGGSERYESFSGETESPAPREVIFADGGGRAHARRWTNRQSSYSAVREQTRTVLIVAEALHASAQPDMQRLVGLHRRRPRPGLVGGTTHRHTDELLATFRARWNHVTGRSVATRSAWRETELLLQRIFRDRFRAHPNR
jgi:DNA/RNA-binding domain of Phe-tRNA-synthetase-like protein